MWQLTMYCRWKPPDAMPLLALNVLGLGHQRPNFNGYIYITMRHHLIRLALAPFISSRLATSAWLRFPCVTREKHNAEFTKGGWELWSYLSHLWTKFPEIFSRCRKPLVLSNCLCHVSFRRYSPLILEVVEKPSKCKSLLAPNFL